MPKAPKPAAARPARKTSPLENLKKCWRELFDATSGAERFLLGSWLIIVALLPIHAFVSTWGGSSIGPLEVWKSWKEILLVVALVTALAYLVATKRLNQVFRDRLVWLIFAYVGLHLLCWIVFRPPLEAVSAAFLMNLRFLGMLLLSLVLLQFVKLPALLSVTAWIITLSGLFVVAFGILQITILPKDFLAHFGYSASTIAPYITLDNNEDIVRIASTLRGPNPLGAYLIIIGLLLFALWRRSRQLFLVGGGFMLLVVLFWTHSRSAWLGFAAAAAAYAWLNITNVQVRRKLVWTGLAGITAAAAALVVLVPQSVMLQNLVLHNKIGDPDAGSTVEHFEKSFGSVEDVLRHPFGQGPGTAGPASFYSHTPNVPENYYLQIAEEVGLVGLALFAAINVAVVVRLWPRRQEFWPKILLASFAGIFIVNMFLHGWADETLAMTWWAIAGLFMLAPANTAATAKNRAPRLPRSS